MHHHLAYNKENKTETDPRPRFKPTVKKPEQRHPADNFTTKITLLISSLRSDIRSEKKMNVIYRTAIATAPRGQKGISMIIFCVGV